MSPSRGVLPLVLATVFFACRPATPDAPASSPEAGPSAPTAAAEETSPSPVPSAAESATEPPADTRVRDACAKLCERVKTGCAEGRGDACVAQCAGHEARSKGCEADTEAALTCQLKAADNFCGGVAASICNDAFLRMQRCQRGEAQPVAVARQELPEGWERVSDATWGVSLAMPKGAAVDEGAKSRTWKATLDGSTYEVIELPSPAKMESTDLIKLVIAHVGISCQREMRLTGRVDKDTLTFTRYETGCSSERLYGKLRIDGKRALSMVVRGGAPTELREAFLEGLR